MIDELRIRGLGVIDEAVLPLGPGLTVVTGETGAGKTMVVTGLLLLFGGRADAARVRTGSAQASVEGRLAVPREGSVRDRVLAAGGELDDDAELVLRRVVSASGRSRAFVGGASTPVATLTELSDELVAVHGQTDQLRLTRPGAQRDALDRFAGLDLAPFGTQFRAWREADEQLTDRVARAAQLRRESDLLMHGLNEIEVLDPQPGELHELARRAARLGHADALKLAARTAHDAVLGRADDPLGDTADAATLLGVASRTLAQVAGEDAELDELAVRLTELQSLAVQAGSDLGAYADHLESDPEELDHTETRRAALNTLVRKYCDEPEPSLDGVLRWAEQARDRLARIDVSDEALARLRARRDAAAGSAATLAAELTARRHEAAHRLATAVTAELSGLAMADARLDIGVGARPATASGAVLTIDGREVGVTVDGADEVEFLLAPHRGAPVLALGRGASGGELSRVMLALEVSLAGSDPVPTLVFDEVDAGVGGRAAVEVGRRLARLARERQVLVVTHLAQVAGFADRHIVVDKPQGGGAGAAGSSEAGAGGVTASDVRVVEGEHRIGELARMLAGSDTPAAREHAAELLDTAAAERGAADPKPATRRRRKV